MLKGLKEVSEECAQLNIQFHLMLTPAAAADVLPEMLVQYQIDCLVTDQSPLRLPKKWVEDVAEAIPANVSFYQV
jgi:deoxyribodipyrimidine photo-lyase